MVSRFRGNDGKRKRNDGKRKGMLARELPVFAQYLFNFKKHFIDSAVNSD
jgi:hypothetical protein